MSHKYCGTCRFSCRKKANLVCIVQQGYPEVPHDHCCNDYQEDPLFTALLKPFAEGNNARTGKGDHGMTVLTILVLLAITIIGFLSVLL